MSDVTRCDCQWTGDDIIALDDLAPERPCGCGQHDVRIYRDEVWHWRDQHWTSGCLIVALSAAVREGESVASAPRKEAASQATEPVTAKASTDSPRDLEQLARETWLGVWEAVAHLSAPKTREARGVEVILAALRTVVAEGRPS